MTRGLSCATAWAFPRYATHAPTCSSLLTPARPHWPQVAAEPQRAVLNDLLPVEFPRSPGQESLTEAQRAEILKTLTIGLLRHGLKQRMEDRMVAVGAAAAAAQAKHSSGRDRREHAQDLARLRGSLAPSEADPAPGTAASVSTGPDGEGAAEEVQPKTSGGSAITRTGKAVGSLQTVLAHMRRSSVAASVAPSVDSAGPARSRAVDSVVHEQLREERRERREARRAARRAARRRGVGTRGGAELHPEDWLGGEVAQGKVSGALPATTKFVLAIDDVQGLDAASFELLVDVLQQFRGRVLVWCFATASDPDSVLTAHGQTFPLGADVLELWREFGGERVFLDPLTAQQSASLLGHLLNAPLHPSVARSLHYRADGNPLALVGLARHQAENGMLVPCSQHVDAPYLPPASQVPRTLAGMMVETQQAEQTLLAHMQQGVSLAAVREGMVSLDRALRDRTVNTIATKLQHERHQRALVLSGEEALAGGHSGSGGSGVGGPDTLGGNLLTQSQQSHQARLTLAAQLQSRAANEAQPQFSIFPLYRLASIGISHNMESTITGEAARLVTPSQLLLLKVASVVGREFSLRTLVSVHPIRDVSQKQLIEDIQQLCAQKYFTIRKVRRCTATGSSCPSHTHMHAHANAGADGPCEDVHRGQLPAAGGAGDHVLLRLLPAAPVAAPPGGTHPGDDARDAHRQRRPPRPPLDAGAERAEGDRHRQAPRGAAHPALPRPRNGGAMRPRPMRALPPCRTHPA